MVHSIKEISMKKSKIIELLKSATENTNIINVHFDFDVNYYNLIPLTSNDNLFLSINEDDFIFDGYSVYRLNDIVRVKIKNDFCDKILLEEGLTTNITIPSIDINNWKSVFESLAPMNKNIIVEKQTIDPKHSKFVIGRIHEIHKKYAYVWNFDANGEWNDYPTRVPYSEITNVEFGSRYVETFSKYVEEPPLNK